MRDIKRIKKLVIHHSAARPEQSTLADIREWHEARGLAENGYTGYHYFVGNEGDVVADRPERYWGAHCKGHNHDSLGIVLPGDFRWQEPTRAQVEGLVLLLAELVIVHNLKYWNIYPHGAMKWLFFIPTTDTKCPGNNLEKMMPDIRRRVKVLVGQ